MKAGETVRTGIPLDPLTDTVVNERGEREKVHHMTFHIGMSQPDPVSVRMGGVLPLAITI